MATDPVTPPLPPGFTLDAAPSATPPLPPGFTLDGAPSAATPEPMDKWGQIGDAIAGHPAARLAKGAVLDPIMGLGQLGAQGVDSLAGTQIAPRIDQYIQQLNEAKERGMKAAGNEGADVMGFLGNLAPAGAIGKALPAATSLMGKIGTGALQGAAVGATTPVTSPTDFASHKAQQVVGGGIVGGAIPAVGAGINAGIDLGKSFVQPFTKSGQANLLRKYESRLLGDNPAAIDEAKNALFQAKDLVPGSQTTTAEALANTPRAAGLAGFQSRVAKVTGQSGDWQQLYADKDSARVAALKARDTVGDMARTGALDAANASGGVQSQPIVNSIDTMLSKPELAASNVVSPTLNAVKEKLATLTNPNGTIDAKALYTVRKELGNTIDKFAKENQNWDKKLTGGLERDIQKAMDEAIEASGGTGWKKYLSDYAEASKAVDADKVRQVAAAKFSSKTNYDGAQAIHEGVKFPALINWKVKLADSLYKGLGKDPAHDAIMKLASEQYQNPGQMLQSLNGLGQSRQQAIIDALTKRAQEAAAVAAARGVQ